MAQILRLTTLVLLFSLSLAQAQYRSGTVEGGDKVLDDADGLIDEPFLRPAHPHTVTNGPPEAGACLMPGHKFVNALTGHTYNCQEAGGNPILDDPGDAFNQLNNGTVACSATGSTALQFPSTTALTCPTVVNGVATTPLIVVFPAARTTYDFACSDTATTPEYLLATAGRLTTGCVASGDATDGRYLVASDQTLQSCRCQAPTGPAAGQTWTMTVQDTGTDTTLICAMTNPATTCACTGGPHDVVGGDRLSIKKDDSDATDGAGVRCVVEAAYR